MVSIIVLALAFIAGVLIYFSLRKDAEKYLNMSIEKNILFPLFIISLIVLGVYIAQYVHLTETAGRLTNSQQLVSVMGCIIENQSECSTLVNNLNNAEYAKLQSGEISRGTFYIPFSLQSSILSNALTYFCSGALLVWLGLFIIGVVKK